MVIVETGTEDQDKNRFNHSKTTAVKKKKKQNWSLKIWSLRSECVLKTDDKMEKSAGFDNAGFYNESTLH